MKLPTGNGQYIWILSRCTGGDPSAIVEKALSSGLRWVAIKVADGYYPYNQGARLDQTVKGLRSAGILTLGWHYVYGYSPVREAEVAANISNSLGLDGFVIDAEVEFKRPGMGSVATQYLATLKRKLAMPIGLTSFRFPYLHREFTWKEFLPHMDFHQPQVYWIGARNPGYQLRRCIREFDTLYRELGMRTDMPTQPLGAAFTQDSWNPTVAEIIEFRKTSNELGLPGYGWWEWYFAETRNPVWWDATTQAIEGEDPRPQDPPPNGEPPPVDEPPMTRLVATRHTDLRMRKSPYGEIVAYMPQYKVYSVLKEDGDWLCLDVPDPLWVHGGYVDNVKKVVCRINNLRVRSGPSLNHSILGYMQADVITNIVSVSGKWGRLEGSSERWVHMDYVTTL